jgi:hypothetical protein
MKRSTERCAPDSGKTSLNDGSTTEYTQYLPLSFRCENTGPGVERGRMFKSSLPTCNLPPSILQPSLQVRRTQPRPKCNFMPVPVPVSASASVWAPRPCYCARTLAPLHPYRGPSGPNRSPHPTLTWPWGPYPQLPTACLPSLCFRQPHATGQG